jgi:hypothetical protein
LRRVSRLHESEIENIERSILRYFVRNPRAADTLEGITRWRLLHERIDRGFEQTSQALGRLVSQGYLLEEISPVSGSIFRLNLAKRAESQALLSEPYRARHGPARTGRGGGESA